MYMGGIQKEVEERVRMGEGERKTHTSKGGGRTK